MTTNPSTAVVVYDPDRADPEKLALAAFLGGYRGLTRNAYALDLRQFAAYCEKHRPSRPPGSSSLVSPRSSSMAPGAVDCQRCFAVCDVDDPRLPQSDPAGRWSLR